MSEKAWFHIYLKKRFLSRIECRMIVFSTFFFFQNLKDIAPPSSHLHWFSQELCPHCFCLFACFFIFNVPFSLVAFGSFSLIPIFELADYDKSSWSFLHAHWVLSLLIFLNLGLTVLIKFRKICVSPLFFLIVFYHLLLSLLFQELYLLLY